MSEAIIVFATLLALSVSLTIASPVYPNLSFQNAIQEDGLSEIVTQKFIQNDVGDYEFSFETSNGIRVKQMGDQIHDETDPEKLVLQIQGEYFYRDPLGKDVDVIYSAGKEGFQPESSWIPTTPEPPLFVRSLYLNGPRKPRRKILS